MSGAEQAVGGMTRDPPESVVAGLTTKSDRIRALDKAGYSRVEIAAYLDVRYQHVRGVLVKDGARALSSKVPTVVHETVNPEPQIAAPWAMERLLSAGFTLVGQCEGIGADSFSYSAPAPREPGVYAFAVDGLVMYVGLTRYGLRTRLGHYVYGHAQQRTSARVKGLILGALADGRSVSVLVAMPPQMMWNGLPVDGAAGLETGLIAALQPPWNQQGVKARG